MEKEIRLIWKKRANNSVKSIFEYIAQENPQNAETFVLRMIAFGEKLSILPPKYAPCRYRRFENRGYFCVVFEKNYVLVFRFKQDTIFICNVIHTSRLLT